MTTDLHDLVASQRDFFDTGHTRDLAFRIDQLRRLQNAVENSEAIILKALEADLGKFAYEAYLSEIGIVRSELRLAIKKVRKWAAPKRVRTSLICFPGSSRIHSEPYGVTLIISPWNYPFLLAMTPLIGALAAGNCCILKPSEFAPRTSAALAKLIADSFEEKYASVVQGEADVGEALLAQRFDSIFYTGGAAVARLVMQAAARHLTPVTLELGGKSPCIVDQHASADHAARKIVAGKFLNAGQTCIAPDYVLVHESQHAELVEHLKAHTTRFYGEDASRSRDYARIVNRRHFDRLAQLLQNGRILFGGDISAAERYIAPTLIDSVDWEDPIMQEEIFGPVLPILTYTDINQAVEKVRSLPKPLALYLFSDNTAVQHLVIEQLSFGGGCINDTLIQFTNPHLPFGGVGDSGMGRYHGRFSFENFSHFKAVMKKPARFHMPLRYPPYGKLKWLRKILR